MQAREPAAQLPAATRIPIRFARLRLLFVVLGTTPHRSYLELREDVLTVEMAWGSTARIDRTAVRSAHRAPNTAYAIGVHGWNGRWIVNGAASPMVSIAIEPAARVCVLGFPAALSELLVSVDDPAGLVSALGSS